jgi:hypothetical protein
MFMSGFCFYFSIFDKFFYCDGKVNSASDLLGKFDEKPSEY